MRLLSLYPIAKLIENTLIPRDLMLHQVWSQLPLTYDSGGLRLEYFPLKMIRTNHPINEPETSLMNGMSSLYSILFEPPTHRICK
jgi:hypothetical protein